MSTGQVPGLAAAFPACLPSPNFSEKGCQVKTTKSVFGSVLVVVAALLLAGCATTNAQAGSMPEAEEALTPQLVETSRATVTAEQYEASFTKFAECMRRSGVAMVAQETVGGVHYFSFPSEAQAGYEACYSSFAEIDVAWQLQNEYNNPTQVALRACLEEAGVTPGKTVAEVWDQVQRNSIDPVACTTKE